MEFMRDQKVLHKKYLWMLLLRVKDILKALPALVDLEIPQYFSFSSSFNYFLEAKKLQFAVTPMDNSMMFLIFSILMEILLKRIHTSSMETSLIGNNFFYLFLINCLEDHSLLKLLSVS